MRKPTSTVIVSVATNTGGATSLPDEARYSSYHYLRERDSFSSPSVRRQRMEKVKEATTEVKESTTEVVDKLRPERALLVSLRETLCSERFDDKRTWRRILSLRGAIGAPFCR